MAFVRTDRFGNATLLKLAKPVVNKKTGDVMPIFRTHVEIGNTLYRVQISESKKDDRPGMWVQFTKLQRGRHSGGFGGGGQYGGGQKGF